MKKLSKITAILATTALLLGAFLTSCSNDNSDTGNQDASSGSSTQEADGTTTLKIQENASAGFVSTTGEVKTEFGGWTGSGYIDGVSKGGNIVYTVNAEADITDAKIALHYLATEVSRVRGAVVSVNGTALNESTPFAMATDKKVKKDSASSADWKDTGYLTNVSLKKGSNSILITGAASGTFTSVEGIYIEIAEGNSGCLNYVDYLIVNGKGISAGSASDAKSYYTLSYSSENETAGSVTGNVSTGSVEEDSSVTLTATANPDWKFECWTDGSTENPYTFTFTGNKYVMAHFIPDGYTAPTDLVGYATITSDSAASYTITGGAGGETITISSLSDMESNEDKLKSDTPYIIKVTGTVTTTDNVSVYYTIGSNKTLYSMDGNGRFKNVEVRVEGENVIIRNLKFGEVIAYDTYGGSGNDALALNKATHVWIDHCELFSHLTPQDNITGQTVTNSSDSKFVKDFYDGLLDIKNGSTWITISNCYVHDHWKASLCGSSGDSKADTNDRTGATDKDVRVTFYGNYWKNINSRQPLVRWGKVHIFNDYFLSESSNTDTYQQSNCIDVRIDSQVLAEANYFSGVKNVIGLDLANGGTDSTGSAGYSFPSSNVVDSSCRNTPSSTGGSYSYSVPYSYSNSMKAASKDVANTAGANLTSLSY